MTQSTWTEGDVIGALSRAFPHRADVSPRGIGDDCAVLRDGNVLITTDASVEGVHFDLHWMTPAQAAWRCLASNVSDVAAMGASAGPFTLALCLPPSMPFEDIEAMAQAMRDCIDAHGLPDCWLVGGDVVRAPMLAFSVTVLGMRPPWPVVMRTGARPGDAVVVFGNPGYAAAGLEICWRGLHRAGQSPETWAEPFVRAFCTPVALTRLGPELARRQIAAAMMDTSDGIRTDLPRLLRESGCGARIDVARLVPDEALARAAETLAADPVAWMLDGGEDFGLIATCHRDMIEAARECATQCGVAMHVIGECVPGQGVEWLEGEKPCTRPDTSFSHFG